MPPEVAPTIAADPAVPAPVVTRRETRLPTQRRAAAPSSYNPETHTVDLTAATGTRVLRWGWDGPYLEELDMSPQALVTTRIDADQVPLLDSHNRWSISDQLGVVVGARIEGGQLVTPVRFDQETPRGREAEARVAAGNLRGVSIGYRPLKMIRSGEEGGVPIFLVTSWELTEASLTPVPADPDAGMRSADDLHPCIIEMETRAMPPEVAPTIAADPAAPAPAPETRAAPAAPASPAAPAATAPAAPAAVADASAVRMDAGEVLDFVDFARSFGVEGEQVRTWATTLSPDAARQALMRSAADQQRARTPLTPAMGAARVTVDERDTARMAMASALLHRHNPANELHEAGREYRGMSLLEMTRRNLERNGEKVSGLGRREIADLALRQHSTSDFPNVLSNVSNRTLRAGYEAVPQTFKAWQRRATVPDFRQVTRLQLGGAPSFLLVPEGGSFKMGTIGEAKEVYALATYGRRFAITRQTIINDDVDAFTRIPSMWGRAAADFESDAAYAPLIANPNMGDGVPLFHATHGNLRPGAAISEDSWSDAEQAMAAQVGIEGRPISATPAWMIVAPKDKVAALKLRGSPVSQKAGATPGTTNVYENAFNVVVEARLSRSSGAVPWFYAADNSQIDTIEYAYLEGDDGVFLDERTGFEVDGIEYKARLDFAVKAIDAKGMGMNPSV
ncbi:prohead protease/major capsid protein fusion protein [Caulobacter sp. UNC279MFTsu5.1]|uniref:prohead protease/major capsid protein fusion protein n=1 Tax=Caulobacter sp. UNC279MFTsu5.1 TaxID=1502775 RepID=UPI0008E21070|nr:prohead protease/major capsid protein fusion protein [Caulobacter sp. UNC279MFTsu5.1]SFK41773.1 phage prohead protease, HK97 family [Caulobacter sp. UNC279MFTsu5.1]